MRVLGVSIALIVGAYLGYLWAFPTYTYRYRMTVEVTVDGEIKSGAAVIEVRMRKQTQFIAQVPPFEATVTGDAVFVDLGQKRNVVALLASGLHATDVDYPIYVVPQHFKLSNSDADVSQYPSLRGSWCLLREQLPTLVTVPDPNEPKTARVLQPDEFEQVFGPGVRFKRAHVEMVPAGWWLFSVLGWPSSLGGVPVTRGIENKLPMLVTHREWMWSVYSQPLKFSPQYHLFVRK